MAVNLTKPFKGREFTPIHLIDEETSIATAPRASSKEIFSAKTSTSVHLAKYMDDIIEGIQDANSIIKAKFITEFYKEVKAQRKIIKADNICRERPWIIVGVICILTFIIGLVLPIIFDGIISIMSNPSEEEVSFIKCAVAVVQPWVTLAGILWTIVCGLMIYRIRN